ncbi:MAG: type II toxin-antitoxin system Phd/YefM family antitoxin [Acidobacteriota bacterium]
MPSRYSIAEARAQLPSIIDQAESGVPVALTRRGEPVAVLISIHEFERLGGHQKSFRQAYQQFLAKVQLNQVGVGPEFASSLRDRSAARDVSL